MPTATRSPAVPTMPGLFIVPKPLGLRWAAEWLPGWCEAGPTGKPRLPKRGTLSSWRPIPPAGERVSGRFCVAADVVSFDIMPADGAEIRPAIVNGEVVRAKQAENPGMLLLFKSDPHALWGRDAACYTLADADHARAAGKLGMPHTFRVCDLERWLKVMLNAGQRIAVLEQVK